MSFFGSCAACEKDDEGYVDTDGTFYCDLCWEIYALKSYRCYTFAVVYDAESGQRLSIGSSISNTGCAERQALWKLHSDNMLCPKVVVVARLRKNRNDTKMSLGDSKPCGFCIMSMTMYNVVRVCYSAKEVKGNFVWTDIENLTNDYLSKSKVLVRL